MYKTCSERHRIQDLMHKNPLVRPHTKDDIHMIFTLKAHVSTQVPVTNAVLHHTAVTLSLEYQHKNKMHTVQSASPCSVTLRSRSVSEYRHKDKSIQCSQLRRAALHRSHTRTKSLTPFIMPQISHALNQCCEFEV